MLFGTKLAEVTTHYPESYLRYDHKKHQFLMTIIYELLSEVSKHCDLKALDHVDKDVVEKTNFTLFFLDDKSGRLFTLAEAIMQLPNRVFTINGAKNLHREHFNNLCKRA